MKRLLFLLIPLQLLAQPTAKPKLVIAIVADQMRYEMLNRYSEHFTDKGFNLLREKGFSFENCNFGYMPTYTAPGHATIFTGNMPKTHGIIGNDWYVPAEDRYQYCTEDKKVKPVGTEDENCKRSPIYLETPSLADYITEDPKAKSYGISIKDRAAILPSGQNPNGAFWMDKDANFVSSTYYGKKLPNWLVAFNAMDLPSKYLEKPWDLLLDKSAYAKSSDADKRPFEKTSLNKTATFPYNLKEAQKRKGDGIIKNTPFSNSMLVDLAQELIINESLGKDNITDFLSISFSATDYIGHSFGPYSHEVQDAFLRLDRDIEKLIAFLDREVGEGEYVLFLTADHGVVDCPTRNGKGLYINKKEFKKYLEDYCISEFGQNLILEVANYQVWLDHNKMDEYFLDEDHTSFMILKKIVEYQNGNAFETGFTQIDILDCLDPECFAFANSYKDDLSGDIFFTLKEGNLLRSSNYGTSHGSGYEYDTHVPFIIYGAGIKPGKSNDKIDVTDIAPTILNILGLTPKAQFDGTSRDAQFERLKTN